jgi:tricorn protease
MTISAGEGMSNHMRKLKLGRSFGARTWGGYVGLGGTPSLVDGSSFNIPNGPFFDDGKWLLENRGFIPDELVVEDKSGKTDPQLERAVRWAMAELKKHGTKRPKPPAALRRWAG